MVRLLLLSFAHVTAATLAGTRTLPSPGLCAGSSLSCSTLPPPPLHTSYSSFGSQLNVMSAEVTSLPSSPLLVSTWPLSHSLFAVITV